MINRCLVSHSQTFNESPDRFAFQTTPILLVVLSRFLTHWWIVWFSAPGRQNNTVGIMSHITSYCFVFLIILLCLLLSVIDIASMSTF